MKRIIIATLVLLLSASNAYATKMIRNADGSIQVAPTADSFQSFKCGKRSVQILSSQNAEDLLFFVSVDKDETILSLDFSKDISKLMMENEYTSNFTLKCLSDKNFIAVHIPHIKNESEDLHLMLMDDGRVMDGYDLTGHVIE